MCHTSLLVEPPPGPDTHVCPNEKVRAENLCRKTSKKTKLFPYYAYCPP
jgi:hypothetical protein